MFWTWRFSLPPSLYSRVYNTIFPMRILSCYQTLRHIRISKTLKHGNNCILELRKYGISSTENRIYGYATCNLYCWLTVSTSLVQAATNIKTNEGSKASKITAGSLWLPWRRSQQVSLKHHWIITNWFGIISQATSVFLKQHFGQCVQFKLKWPFKLLFLFTKYRHARKDEEMTNHKSNWGGEK